MLQNSTSVWSRKVRSAPPLARARLTRNDRTFDACWRGACATNTEAKSDRCFTGVNLLPGEAQVKAPAEKSSAGQGNYWIPASKWCISYVFVGSPTPYRAPRALEVIVKVLAWILTAAALLVGADVFVQSPSFVESPSYATNPDATTAEESTTWRSMEGGNGIPPPPPDMH